jgi:hypothetical protein
MNWDAIEAISAAVASVATLGTLIYLAIQIRESNKLAKSASLQSILESFQTHVVTPLTNDKSIDILDRGNQSFSSLSRIEATHFQNDMLRSMLHIQNVIQLHQNGLLAHVDYHAWLTYAASLVITKGGAECWNALKVSLTPTLVITIDNFIADNPSTPSHTELNPHRIPE